jgi:hypothetical protein
MELKYLQVTSVLDAEDANVVMRMIVAKQTLYDVSSACDT